MWTKILLNGGMFTEKNLFYYFRQHVDFYQAPPASVTSYQLLSSACTMYFAFQIRTWTGAKLLFSFFNNSIKNNYLNILFRYPYSDSLVCQNADITQKLLNPISFASIKNVSRKNRFLCVCLSVLLCRGQKLVHIKYLNIRICGCGKYATATTLLCTKSF